MPKQRTKRSARKRFSVTGKGKFRRAKAFKSHILTKKHPKRKRGLRGTTIASDADQGRLRRLLPALGGK